MGDAEGGTGGGDTRLLTGAILVPSIGIAARTFLHRPTRWDCVLHNAGASIFDGAALHKLPTA